MNTSPPRSRFSPAKVAAMVQFQQLMSMRPGGVVIMRTGDIDRDRETWSYTPSKHKTQHYGHSRHVYPGERCKALSAKGLTAV